MSRTIKQSIYDLLNIYQPYPKLITEHKDAIDQALKEIEELILASLPEEIMPEPEQEGADADYCHGHNDCISDTKANLLKKLGGER